MRVCIAVVLAACAPSERPIVQLRWTASPIGHTFAVDAAGDVYSSGDQADHQGVWIAKQAHDNGATAWTIHITAVDGTIWMPHLGTDAANDVLVTGFASGQVDFGGTITNSSAGPFAAKFSPNGDFLWMSPIPAGCGLGIAASPNGRVYAIGDVTGSASSSGNYLAAFEADGTPRWMTTYASFGNEIAVASATNEHVVVSSFGGSTAAASFSADGEAEWAKPVLIDGGSSTTTDSHGDIVASDGDTIAAFDPAGSKRWSLVRSAEPGAAGISALAALPDGTIGGATMETIVLYGSDGSALGERWLTGDAPPSARWHRPATARWSSSALRSLSPSRSSNYSSSASFVRRWMFAARASSRWMRATRSTWPFAGNRS